MASKKRKTLGQRLLELIEEHDVDIYEYESIEKLRLAKIIRNKNKPKSPDMKDRVRRMTHLIRNYGLKQPIIVKPKGNHYVVLHGEVRVRALKRLGYKHVPAVIRDYDAFNLAELALIEILKRDKQMDVIQTALMYRRMIQNLEFTHQELADKVGKSRSYITNTIGLLKLPTNVLNDLNRGLITYGHARALSKIGSDVAIIKLNERIKKESLTVREIEREALQAKCKHQLEKQASTEVPPRECKQKIEEWILNMIGENVEVYFRDTNMMVKFRDYGHLEQLFHKIQSEEEIVETDETDEENEDNDTNESETDGDDTDQ